LRELGHPIQCFGEVAADRRERLKTVCAEYILEKGDMPDFHCLSEAAHEKMN